MERLRAVLIILFLLVAALIFFPGVAPGGANLGELDGQLAGRNADLKGVLVPGRGEVDRGIASTQSSSAFARAYIEGSDTYLRAAHIQESVTASLPPTAPARSTEVVQQVAASDAAPRASEDRVDVPSSIAGHAENEAIDVVSMTRDGETSEPMHASDAGPAATEVTGTVPEQSIKYGFYLHVHNFPAAVIDQVRQLQRHFLGSPIYVMSDGGMDFEELCKREGCTFALCPPANDRWHPWPFFRRLYDAAVALNTEFIVMLEPDNTVHGPITRHPTHDAGGLLVNQRSYGDWEYIEGLAHETKPNYRWTSRSMKAGLAGGSYFRRTAILDAFSDEHVARIDWNRLAEHHSKEIFSSDFAMPYALAARGWTTEPWEDCAQMERDKDQPHTGPKDAAFRHYCGCYPGGKPTYLLQLSREDELLVKHPPERYRILNSNCQVCYNYTKYIQNWGSARCTNSKPFEYSDVLLHRYKGERQR